MPGIVAQLAYDARDIKDNLYLIKEADACCSQESVNSLHISQCIPSHDIRTLRQQADSAIEATPSRVYM